MLFDEIFGGFLLLLAMLSLPIAKLCYWLFGGEVSW